MTMVHFDTKAISRKAGQSAVACAAYRAGDILKDVKYGKIHDYSRKRGVMSADIVLPLSLKALGVSVDREMVWNLAEAAENRSDSRVAREWLINLPYELSEKERHMLALEFAQKLADDMDVIADVCIHRPVMKLPFDTDAKPSSKRLREGEKNPDPRNFHAHILVTTRAPTLGPNKTLAFDPKLKIPFEWSNKKRLAHDLPSSMKEIKRIREMWVDTANVILAEKNLPLMDARSYKDQGLDQQPTIKMGVEATAMERLGITTEKGNTNRAIKERNKMVAKNRIQQRTDHERRARKLRDGLAWATEHNERLPDLIADTKQRVDRSKRNIEITKSGTTWATERCQKIPNGINTVNNRIKSADDGIKWAADHTENLPKLIRDTEQRIKDTEPKLEWTTKRCKNLPNWIDGADQRNQKSQQRVDRSKQWIDFNSKRAGRSEHIAAEINQGITERAKPAPSPFDNEYERAFFKRKRQIDQKTRDAARHASEAEQNTRRIKAATLDKKKVLAYRLLMRNHDSKRLRKGRNEKSEHYPEKFDYRQIAILNEFAHSLGIHTIEKEYLEKHELVVDMLSLEVMQNNLAAINILVDNQKERSHHQTVTADFYDFIAKLDKQRAEQVQQHQTRLGRNDTSRVTATIITAQPYLAALTKYANNSEKTDKNRALAEQHINQTIRLTAKQYEVAYKGLNTLISHDSVQKHVRELGDSLGRFTTDYAEKLSGDDLRSINNGLKVIDTEIEISNTSQRVVTQNLGPSISI
ncbi:MobA/MobL family protein [uncultured Psychrobacter sp.]|uniref:MobA/MobL family protein n=1 Tax=uncultured Psychrobacter sp. TaxID=259303 RepID=UPI00263A025C|nr:MobA/MobL family protein [uncultured Psychrobacter sp.]